MRPRKIKLCPGFLPYNHRVSFCEVFSDTVKQANPPTEILLPAHYHTIRYQYGIAPVIILAKTMNTASFPLPIHMML